MAAVNSRLFKDAVDETGFTISCCVIVPHYQWIYNGSGWLITN